MVAIYFHDTEAIVAGLIAVVAGLTIRRWWVAILLGAVAGYGAFAAMMYAAQNQSNASDVAAAFVSFFSPPIIAGGMMAALLGWLLAYVVRRLVPKQATGG